MVLRKRQYTKLSGYTTAAKKAAKYPKPMRRTAAVPRPLHIIPSDVAFRPTYAGKIGHDVNSNTTKTKQVKLLTFVGRNTRTQYTTKLTVLEKGTAINQRERDIVNFIGINLTCEWRNLSNEVLQCHVAIVSPLATPNVNVTNFFRNPNGTRRARDFDTTLASTEFMNLPINTDEYVVLKHERFTLGRVKDETVTTEVDNLSGDPNYKSMKMWLPVNRQLRFDGTNDTPQDSPIFLVYWVDKFMTPENQIPENDAFQMSFLATQVFREPKN